MGSGDGSETGSVTKKKGKRKINEHYWWQPHPGKKSHTNNIFPLYIIGRAREQFHTFYDTIFAPVGVAMLELLYFK